MVTSLSQSKGRRRPTKKMEGRQVVTEVDVEGCPSVPEAASTKFVNQCGVIVRARIPITTRLWKTTKPEEQQHAVPAHQKEMLWAELKDMFTLSEGVDQELVKKCALRKMALAFATFKKKLYTNYIKKDKEPNWDDLPQVKPYRRSSNNTNYQMKPKKNPNRPR